LGGGGGGVRVARADGTIFPGNSFPAIGTACRSGPAAIYISH